VDASTRCPSAAKKPRRECQTCAVKMVCQGGCPAHLNAAGNNRLCGGYYRFFSEILAPLRPFSRDLNGLRAWRAALSTVGDAHPARPFIFGRDESRS
jgi:uncharacterized protein